MCGKNTIYLSILLVMDIVFCSFGCYKQSFYEHSCRHASGNGIDGFEGMYTFNSPRSDQIVSQNDCISLIFLWIPYFSNKLVSYLRQGQILYFLA